MSSTDYISLQFRLPAFLIFTAPKLHAILIQNMAVGRVNLE